MALVSVVHWQPTGGLVAQVNWLGQKVGSHLALCCIHRMNQGELSHCFQDDDSTIKVILVLFVYAKILTATPLENWRRPPGRPRSTVCGWRLKTIQQDLKTKNLSVKEAIDVAQNRPLWRLVSSTFGATPSWWWMPERNKKKKYQFEHWSYSKFNTMVSVAVLCQWRTSVCFRCSTEYSYDVYIWQFCHGSMSADGCMW